jgi:hypothetical protein
MLPKAEWSDSETELLAVSWMHRSRYRGEKERASSLK